METDETQTVDDGLPAPDVAVPDVTDTSELEAAVDTEAEGGEPVPTELDEPEPGPTPEPEPEAAADEGEGTTPEAEFDAHDPSTWPEDIRQEHEKYQGSTYELAKAAVEQRRTFKTELERRVNERLQRAQPAPQPVERQAPLTSPQLELLTRETNVLADRFDADLASHRANAGKLAQHQDSIRTLTGVIARDRAKLEKLKGSDDDLRISELQTDIAEAEAELREKTGDVRYLETDQARLETKMHLDRATYQERKEKLLSERTRMRTVEDDRRTSESRLEQSTKTQEGEIVRALREAARELNVPEADRRHFNKKMLRYLNGETSDVPDLKAYFLREGADEVGERTRHQASAVAQYGSAKRADIARPAPAGVAKGGDKPLSRQEATRRALANARNIPIT